VIRIGLCGFTIGAAAYFRTFDTLEVQQTFYEPPSPGTLARWRAQAPADFVFTLKAWQVITHRSTSSTYRRMKTRIDDMSKVGGFQLNDTTLRAWTVTRDAARLLDAKAILFQCPASFKPTEENVANLRRFFGAIDRPDGVAFLWEPRGAWPDDLLVEVCRDLDLIHTVDPFLRDTVTPEPLYWRLHGLGSAYRPYTLDELTALAARVPPGANGYVMFNNIPRVADAKTFMGLLNGRRRPAG
jgi:uncharacterized protein YecE (DUF72 family)